MGTSPAASGASAPQARWKGGDNQQWRLDNLGSSTVGSTVGRWTPDNSTNDQWTITSA